MMTPPKWNPDIPDYLFRILVLIGLLAFMLNAAWPAIRPIVELTWILLSFAP